MIPANNPAHWTPQPAERRIQVFAFDPALETDLDAAPINQAAITVPWETLAPGPVGEYLEVVDIDPASQCAYEPVDLNHPHVLATDGHRPSDGVPQFHQQMVYAVAMKTIDNFERALGRPVLWGERIKDESHEYLPRTERYVQRLRIYPHGFRGENAYYSPQKKALLFGYFNSRAQTASRDLPGGMVFTCSSHDIVAHETTHAILDGIHRRLLVATNDDMLALHEAFGDLVAIFQHFTLPGVLEHQIRQTRGDLGMDSLLSRLAVQFGYATRNGNALRNALGRFDANGQRSKADPRAIEQTTEPHARGAILVAAMFDAFLEIYNRNIADLKRIATQGLGKLPDGDLHPDLVGRFAREASKTAHRLLRACIRALDYLPPVDVTFGDFLRAVITADMDLAPTGSQLVRLAIIEGFRRRGIVPRDVRTLTVEALCWQPPQNGAAGWFRELLHDPRELLSIVADNHRISASEQEAVLDVLDKSSSRDAAADKANLEKLMAEFLCDPGNPIPNPGTPTQPVSRKLAYVRSEMNCIRVYGWLQKAIRQSDSDALAKVRQLLQHDMGLSLRLARARAGLETHADIDNRSGHIELHKVRTRYQARSDGTARPQLIVLLTQRWARSTAEIKRITGIELEGVEGLWIRGGCTLIIDPDEAQVRFSIAKRVDSEYRLEKIAAFHRQRLLEEGPAAAARYDFLQPRPSHQLDRQSAALNFFEPFAALHGAHMD